MALEHWHCMTHPREEAPGVLVAEFQIREDSPWFSGHFPQNPILPGIAILLMASEIVRYFEAGPQRGVRIAGVKRVRFRLPVRPRDTLTVVLTGERGGGTANYGFEARLGDDIACTGIVISEAVGPAEKA